MSDRVKERIGMIIIIDNEKGEKKKRFMKKRAKKINETSR